MRSRVPIPMKARLLHWASRWRWLVDAGILTSGSVAVAVAGLIVGDLLPTNGQPVVLDRARFAWFTLSLSALLLLMGLQRQVRQRKGTLYYVRLLFQSMPDWHFDRLQNKNIDYLRLRVVARWISQADDHRVLDAVGDVQQVARDVQRALNDNAVGVGHHIAPNMLWPTAVALGHELYAWEGTTLEELGHDPISWPFPTQSPSCGSYTMPTIRTTPAVASAAGMTASAGMSQPENVLVTLDLTVRPRISAVRGWNFVRRYRVAVFENAQAGIDSPCLRTLVSATSPALGCRDVVVHPWNAVEQSVRAIRQALHENPDSYVFVAAQIPKTVSVAIGWKLANDDGIRLHPTGERCAQASCRFPWTRLVLLQYDKPTRRHLAMRVNPAQPSVPVLRSLAAPAGWGAELETTVILNDLNKNTVGVLHEEVVDPGFTDGDVHLGR